MVKIPKKLIDKLQPQLKEAEISLEDLVVELLEEWMLPLFNVATIRLTDGYVLGLETEKLCGEDTFNKLKKKHPEALIYHAFHPIILNPKEHDCFLSVSVVSDKSIADLIEHGLAWHREFCLLGREKFVQRYWDLSNYELHAPDPLKDRDPLPEYESIDWANLPKRSAA